MKVTPPRSEPFPYLFVVISFVGSVAIGVAIVYFGIQGQLGAGIP